MAATTSSGPPATYICKLASFLKDYMTTMEQMPKEIQLVSSQIMELDKNSDQMLSELEEITGANDFAGDWIPTDLRRRVTKILIDMQTTSDEQHRLMSDISENSQRHTHKIESQRKEAEVQLRLASNKMQGGNSKQNQDGFEVASTTSRDLGSLPGHVSTPQEGGGTAGVSKKKRLRESGIGGPSNAKQAKKSKEVAPVPLGSSTPSSGAMRRVTGGHRKNAGVVSSVKKEPATPVASTMKKKKKTKNISPAASSREKHQDKHASDKPHQSCSQTSSNVSSNAPNATPTKAKANRRRPAGQEKDVASAEPTAVPIASSNLSRRRGSQPGVDPSSADDEPRYCFCNRVSLGAMVACDGPRCEVEWFHFECVGLTEAPKGNWYCSQCEQNSSRPSRRAKSKSGGGGGSGR